MGSKHKIVVVAFSVLSLGIVALWSLPDNAPLNFGTECRFISDPTDVNLYHHEDIVNSFLEMRERFGSSRLGRMVFNHKRQTFVTGTARSKFYLDSGAPIVPGDWESRNVGYKIAAWGLVGILEREKPVVYFVKSAERAQKLNERSLDAFESYALTRLKAGEKLVVWERSALLRYMGAIRAEVSCLSCHKDSNVGDVLGAFTYTYRKTGVSGSAKMDPLVAAARTGRLTDHELQEMYYDYDFQKSRKLSDAGFIHPEMVRLQMDVRRGVLDLANRDAKEHKDLAKPAQRP
jgi:Protein of unknown function (DUF3365)